MSLEPRDVRIAVLLTCFNRREKTLHCLRKLHSQALLPRHKIEVFLVDDASLDGTSEAVRTEFPQVRVIAGTGSLFWCRGMHLAWSTAAPSDPAFYLLLNDDTFLFPGALSELLELTGAPENNVIAVGSIVDSATGKLIYGAQHTNIPPHHAANGAKELCNTFNANCVLVSRRVFQAVGMLDDCYSHGLADPDYGYRAFRVGTNIKESRHPVGECSANPIAGTWQDTSLPPLLRLKLSQRPTGLPWQDWLIYTSRHLGWKWPAYFVSPYLKIFLKQ